VKHDDNLALALEAFLGEHRRCGEMDGGVEDEHFGYRLRDVVLDV